MKKKKKRVQIRNTDTSSDIIHLEASSQVVITFENRVIQEDNRLGS